MSSASPGGGARPWGCEVAQVSSEHNGPAPHRLILGGGFAGLYAARGLKRAPVRVTVVDRRNHHLFQPMLYQVATAALNPSDIAAPIRSVLRNQSNANVLLAEVWTIDPAARRVVFADGGELTYDYLVVATGARHSYFGHDDWERLAPGLKSIEDAVTIRQRVLLAFEQAEREPDPVRRHALLTFVVVGGGPTGVETAGALAELRRYALRRDFRHIDPGEATVLLLEGGPRLLPSYPPSLSDKAKLELRRLGVEVRTETLVTDIRPGSVVAAGWTIPTQTVIWAAGNVASPVLKCLGTPLDNAGRAIVEPDCTIPGHPEVFVLGDAALFNHQEGGPLPGICPVAIQMGEYTARTIQGDLLRQPRRAFSYWDKGQLAVIGRGRAVADIWKLHFAGFLAWLIWTFVHIFFLIGFRNRVLVMIQWAWSYVTYGRGARLIMTEVEPGSSAGCDGMPVSLSEAVKARARELGFLACGITHPGPTAHGDRLDEWLAKGYAGTMRYLHRQAARRKDPRKIVPEARSVVVVLDNYYTPGWCGRVGRSPHRQVCPGQGLPPGHRAALGPAGRVSSGQRRQAEPHLCGCRAGTRAELAQRAGLGWIGKNTMLIRPDAGSFFFIGSVFTDLQLPADESFDLDRCGSCTRCLDACPTDAFVEPRLLDATRCISYLTIEQKGPIPDELAEQFQGYAFGCDICNDVCPWNQRFAQPTSVPEFQPTTGLMGAERDFFEGMTEQEFSDRFGDTPLERPGLAGMRRNFRAAYRSAGTTVRPE